MKRQRIRKALILISFLLFPVTMNYLSPFIIIMGASMGLVTASAVAFLLMFVGALLLGRSFCGWVCPVAGLQEACFGINDKRFKGGWRNWVKYVIWVPWLAGIFAAAFSAGGWKKLDLLFYTETGISVDSPMKFITYFMVVAILVVPAFLLGRRAACHTLCWMAPFMVLGNKLGRALRIPALHLGADSGKCSGCRQCEKKCPMSLEVSEMAARGSMENSECILCGECVDTCAKKVIAYRFGRR